MRIIDVSLVVPKAYCAGGNSYDNPERDQNRAVFELDKILAEMDEEDGPVPPCPQMVSTNSSYGPVVTRSARRCVRIICGGENTMSYLKPRAHRKTRRVIRNRLQAIAGGADVNGFDPTPPAHLCSDYDIA